MATVADIIARAYRKIGVTPLGETITAAEADEGLSAFNEMLSAWKLAGVNLTYSDLGMADTFPLANEYREGTIYMLAGRLAPEFMVPQGFDADDFFRRIQAAYATAPAVTIDGALTYLGSTLRSRF